ncbi:hypothetical protein J5X84_03165 [Streptosporangiaceae bacterium NEAU-GS5]|nr:hypothetical protein [Streptosporangiaceae bacterium NEAU-GS5]
MTDGPGSTPDVPPGWASNQPPPYGTPPPGQWATPGSVPGPDPDAGQGPGPGPAPGYGPGQGYWQAPGPPGYPGYPQGYGYGAPPAIKPGIIPLRPLNMGDMFNGGVQFIRSNPKATLGLSAMVTAVSQVISLLVQLPAMADFLGAAADPALADDPRALVTAMSGFLGRSLIGGVIAMFAQVVLTGMLTTVLGRSVFGEPITIGQAWALVRSRILPLIGLALLQTVIVGGFIVIAVLAFLGLSFVGAPGGVIALVGFVVVVAAVAGIVFIYTKMSLAGPSVVLERLGVIAAINRSFQLVRGDFWRVFGILLLTTILAGLVASFVTVPFSIAGAIFGATSDNPTNALYLQLVVGALGGIIGGTITNPFTAAVFGLLYTDRRMRSEAFDLVLQTEAMDRQRGGSSVSIDELWHPAYAAGNRPYGYQPPGA